jgi:hypothetical protein
MATLFATDPLKLTLDDRTAIIIFCRENRTKYLASGKGTKTKAEAGPITKLDLGDLDI